MAARPKLILASASPRRLALLQQVGIEPDHLMPTQVDETPDRGELPRRLATRLAHMKALSAQHKLARAGIDDNALILAADTVVAVGRRIIEKTELLQEAAAALRLLSGRNHRVFTGICIITPDNKVRRRLVETRVRFKNLDRDDIEAYLASAEWRGKAGGYAIQGLAGAFIVKLQGSYTNVVGLPLYETVSLLQDQNLPVHFGWLNKGS